MPFLFSKAIHSLEQSVFNLTPAIECVSFRACKVASCCRGRSIPGALHLINHWLLSQCWLQLAGTPCHSVMCVCLDLNDHPTEIDINFPKDSETNRMERSSPQPPISSQLSVAHLKSCYILIFHVFIARSPAAVCNLYLGGFGVWWDKVNCISSFLSITVYNNIPRLGNM